MSTAPATPTLSAAREHRPLLSQNFALFADRHRHLFFGVAVLLYLVAFNGQWQIEPDSALYLDLGKNLSLGRGFTYHGLPHPLAYPGLPVALAGVFKIFGPHAIPAADALILLCGLGGVACTYRMVYLAFDRPTAVVVALGVAICHEVFRYCYEIMTDVPFFLGVMAFLAGYQGVFSRAENSRRRWYDWALLAGGLLIFLTTRPTMLGLMGVWFISMFISGLLRPRLRKLLIPTAGLGLAALAAFMLFETRRGAGPMTTYEQYALYVTTHDLPTRLHHQIPANFSDLILHDLTKSMIGMPLGPLVFNAMTAVVLLIGGVALCRRQLLWGLWVAATFLMLILFVSHDRYVLQILPLLVLGWWLTIRWINRILRRPAGNFLFIVLLALGFLPNLVEVVHVILEQRSQPFLAHYKEGRFPPYVQLAGDLPRYAGPSDIVLSPIKLSRILTFLSDRTVVEEAEFGGLPSGSRVLVVVDPDDSRFAEWLNKMGIDRVGPPLDSVSRPKGGSDILLQQGIVR